MHIDGTAQVGDEGRLGRLVFHVTAQMGLPETPAQALLGAGEEVFENVVGACDKRHDATARVAHERVTAGVFAMAVQIV